MKKIVLASASQSRKVLLETFKIPFECISANIDESPLKNESPRALVLRLSLEKAKAVADQFDDALIIGADTIGIFNNVILCKPQSRENAIEQLQMMSGKTVAFLTGLCLLNPQSQEAKIECETFHVSFRHLSESMILNYLEREQAFTCAGSLKIDGLGMALIEKLTGDDYTALIGLPLIKLTKMLEEMGFDLI